MPFAVQLAHAGRKASGDTPWGKRKSQFKPNEKYGWQTVAPSAIAFQNDEYPPTALSIPEIKQVIRDFASAAERPYKQVSNLLNYTQNMAIYCISSCLRFPINALMNMGVTLRTGLVLH